MHLTNSLFVCLWLIVALCVCRLAHSLPSHETNTAAPATLAAATEGGSPTAFNARETVKATRATAQSSIYKIKRLKPKEQQYVAQQQQAQQKQELRQRHRQRQQEKQQRLQEWQHEMKMLPPAANHVAGPAAVAAKGKKLSDFAKNSHSMNKKLLSQLGFTKVKAPNSHNRKRLAIESRHHASADDSHMFIIKLPPNFQYYANPKSASANTGSQQQQQHSKNALAQPEPMEKYNTASVEAMKALTTTKMATMATLDGEQLMTATNGKKVSSFPFNSNGKPGRIYHWNLPVIKKLLEERQQRPSKNGIHTNAAVADDDAAADNSTLKDDDGVALIDIKDTPTWSKPWENEAFEGKASYAKSNYKKSLKRKSPSYYAPANVVNKNSFNKYFAGNGKPKGFYVIKENQQKPLYYKNIVS